jgi:alpha-L-rhamnosidase
VGILGLNVHKAFLYTLSTFLLALSAGGQAAAPVHLVDQSPAVIQSVAPGVYLVDFGQVAFGNLTLTSATKVANATVRFGEALKDGRVDEHPPGSVRYAALKVTLKPNTPLIVASPADTRNTTTPAVLTSASFGVLIPFRWVEVEGWPTTLSSNQIHRRAAFDSTWKDDAATFQSSDEMLNRVWDLCHYSIKATTFAGVFVDGDRERIAYEADAYLTQLGYYAGDATGKMPRATFDRLMRFPTWPSEWAPQMVFMAYADWMQTGDKEWLNAHYEFLKTKLMSDRVGPGGLVMSSPEQIKHGDIVDWPQQERDGYAFTRVNTVANAFHLQAIADMAAMAQALGKSEEAENYEKQQATEKAEFQKVLFDPNPGLYRDGTGTDHHSLHANLFPLAFHLVPGNESHHVSTWLVRRGMAGSVYAAQYLLEALFENGEDAAAIHLMIAPGDRSWRHMVDSGATITWEAWDQKYKPNQDWNHAWGAAPANLLPRFVLGAQASTPGWAMAQIQPHPGNLSSAQGRIPTPRGTITVHWARAKTFHLALSLPPGMTARVKLPAIAGSTEVLVSNKRAKADLQGQWWALNETVSGHVEIEER